MATPSKRVVLDYTNRDYKSIRSSLVGLAKGFMPEWQTVGENGDFGTLLLELYAYTGDVLNYYIDRVGAEAFLGTAVRRQSVMYIADMFGYRPLGQRAASVPITLSWEWDTDALQNGQLPEVQYDIDYAESVNGTIQLNLTNETSGVSLSVGQTISVYGLANLTDGSKFVITKVTAASGDTPFKAYVKGSGSDWTETPSSPAYVSSGKAVIIPARTKISSIPDADGNVIVFETDRDVILDSAASSQVGTSTVYRVRDVVSAYEGVSTGMIKVGTSQGVPNAEFTLPDPGVIDRSMTVTTREGGQAVPWTRVDKMSLATPTQSVFTTYVDDLDYTHILFGDNASGRIPPANVDIYVDYRYGVGAMANNLGVNTLTTINNDYVSSLGVTASNASSPVGGTDVESVESMRYSIPRSAALKQRAVTLDDFTSLALQVPGITKATAYGANYSTIYVRIASGPQSMSYTTYGVTRATIDNYVGTVTLDRAAGETLVPDQTVYLSDVFSSPVTVLIDTVYYKTRGIRITNVSGSAGTVTLTTDVAHSFRIGQPITVTGVDTTVDGTYLVTDASGSTVKFASSSTFSGSFSSNTVTVNGEMGFSFSINEADVAWFNPDGPSTTPTATTIDPTMQILINSLEQYLSDKKLIGSVVYGEPVEWTNVDLNVFVSVRPLYNREAVRAAVQSAIEDVFKYDNVDFGKRISIGDVYRAGLAVEGVSYITVNEMYETGLTSAVTDVNVSDDPTVATNDPDNAYRIPRINPSIPANWVTAKGGLANT